MGEKCHRRGLQNVRLETRDFVDHGTGLPDILSVFAKIDRLDLLQRLSGPILITPQIKEEVSIPAQYGYQFPNLILKAASTLPLTAEEMTTYEALRENPGRGESEGISLARHRSQAN